MAMYEHYWSDSRYDESQDTISKWGINTFGISSALEQAARMNIEVAELLDLLASKGGKTLRRITSANVQLAEALIAAIKDTPVLDITDVNPDSPLDDDLKTDWHKVADELADVLIVLYQAAASAGVDLHGATDVKMRINRERKWGRDERGYFQHKS